MYWLAESAVMIALAVVLEVLSKMIIPELPFGGQVTAAAMLPVILVAWKYGIGKGLITGFAYSLVQMALGAKTIGAMVMPASDEYLGSAGKVVLMIMLDYVLAYTVLGFASLYKKAIKKNWVSLALGAFTVILFRYAVHIVSGYILFGAWAEWFFSDVSWGQMFLDNFSGTLLSVIYSVVYNGLYMIPEMIVTPIVAAIIGNIPQITKIRK